ncbi:MAG: hypothetical protein WKF62_01400 [Solirubrobacterales bacterium]
MHVEAGWPPSPREPDGPDVREAARGALRTLQAPSVLAANPLARGAGTEQRAASVRQLLEEGIAKCFGDDANEGLMRQVLIRGYLDPAPSHELAASEVSLSRSAYFRRLKLATERLADQIRSEYA